MRTIGGSASIVIPKGSFPPACWMTCAVTCPSPGRTAPAEEGAAAVPVVVSLASRSCTRSSHYTKPRRKMAGDWQTIRYSKTGDRDDFGVTFQLPDGSRRHLRLGFVSSLQATLVGAEPSFTLEDFATRFAQALMTSGAAERSHRGYLFHTTPGGGPRRP